MSDLFYQTHSDTSREAAKQNMTARDYRAKILEVIRLSGRRGKTNDEISEAFAKTGSYFSPRLIELERSGHIVKTAMTRKTRANRQANVYVHSEYYDMLMGKAAKKDLSQLEKLRQENERMANALRLIARAGKVHVSVDDLINFAKKGLGQNG